MEQVGYGKLFLFFPTDIQNNISVHHHNQAVAVCNRILHIVGNHKRCQVIAVYNLIGCFEHLCRRLRIQRRRMLI